MPVVEFAPMDFKLNPSIENPEFPIIYNKYEMLIQEIDVLFQTTNNDVLCSGSDWPNIKDYIFKTKISESTLEQQLKTLIYNKCPSSDNVTIDIKVQIMKGTLSDIGIITVTILDVENVINQKQYYVG